MRDLLQQVLTGEEITQSNAALPDDTDTAAVYGGEVHIALMRRVREEIMRSPFNEGDITILAIDMVAAPSGPIFFEVVRVLYQNWSTEFLWHPEPEDSGESQEASRELRRNSRRVFALRPGAHLGGLLDELGRLNAPEGLSHLGAHHTGYWSRMMGYDYSIPMVIRGWGHKPGYATQVRWKKGGSLENAVAGQRRTDDWWELIKLLLTSKDYSVTLVIKKYLERIGSKRTVYWKEGGSLALAVAGEKKQDEWEKLQDDNGVIYYSLAHHTEGQGEISALQREIENDPDSKRTLTLCLRDNG
jgi:hypothetical protein